MPEATTIDYDQLNEAAQLLYDAAYNKGHQEGRDEHSSESAKRQAQGALDLAEKMLRTASEAPSGEGDATARLLTEYAKLLLRRSPEIYVRRPLHFLAVHGESNRLDMQTAADRCKLALHQLGEYR